MTEFGISKYATYLPAWSLGSTTFGPLDTSKAPRRTRSVAHFDEDAITLGVAALDAIAASHVEIHDLAVATSNPPYLDKSVGATVLAAVAGSASARVSDLHGLRSGVSGLHHALAVKGICVASDLRTSAPGSSDELAHGDAGVAFDCGDEAPFARLVATLSETTEILDRWRLPGEVFARAWDERFTMDVFVDEMTRVAKRALDDAGLEHPTVVVVACANARAAAGARKVLGGAGSDEQIEQAIGHTGAAHLQLLLADAFDRAEVGQTILAINAADGVDAFVFEVVTDPTIGRRGPAVREQIAAATLVTYERFLRWRGILDLRGPNRPEPDAPSSPPSFRRREWKYALAAMRCSACDVVVAPLFRVCPSCGQVDTGVLHSIRDTPGSVVTLTVDHLSPSPDPPVVVAVVDIDGGGRRSAETADLTGGTLLIGDRVVPTFRRLNTSAGIHNYFWKVRPLRPWEVTQ